MLEKVASLKVELPTQLEILATNGRKNLIASLKNKHQDFFSISKTKNRGPTYDYLSLKNKILKSHEEKKIHEMGS